MGHSGAGVEDYGFSSIGYVHGWEDLEEFDELRSYGSGAIED